MVFDRIKYYKNYWKNNPKKYIIHKLNCKKNSKKYSDIFKEKHPDLCIICHKNKRVTGFMNCQSCCEKRKKYFILKRDTARKNKKCTTCFKNKIITGYSMCKTCLKRNNEKRKKRKEESI